MATTTRPRPARHGDRRQPARTGPNPLILITVALVVLAGLVAVGVTLVSGDDPAEVDFDTATAAVEGSPLPTLPESGADPALDRPAPRIEGVDRDGGQVSAPIPGRPTLLLFLAHWCPHCQAEVPVVQQWLDDGGLPEDVDLVGVATATDPSRPNYPPASWLDRESWSPPTLGDADDRAAAAYGLSAFPFWVAVDADGNVVARTSGELTPSQLGDLADTAARR